MFRPNSYGWLYARGGRDIHGKIAFAPRQRIPLSVVRLENASMRTTVRADSSASRGGAHESELDAIFLLPPNHKVKLGDSIEIHGFRVEVVANEPRTDVLTGKIDHYQVGGRVERQK